MTEFSKDSRVHGSRRSNYKQEGLIEHFGASPTARTAAGKVPVFGILKRGGKVYIKVIPDVRSGTFMGIMEHKIVPDSIVHSDSLGSYNAPDVSDFRHFRTNHCELLADRQNQINGIENF